MAMNKYLVWVGKKEAKNFIDEEGKPIYGRNVTVESTDRFHAKMIGSQKLNVAQRLLNVRRTRIFFEG